MASSPSLSELPVGVATDGAAVPVPHPPRCSVCLCTDFNHPILEGMYNCLCEVKSDIKVVYRHSAFWKHGFEAKEVLRNLAFVMACEISPQLSDYHVKFFREKLLNLKVAAIISMKFDSIEIPPDWCSRDLWLSGRINASGDFSFELEGVSSTEVQNFDTPRYLSDNDPKFHFRVLVQISDDPEQYESVVFDIPTEKFHKGKVISSLQSVEVQEHIIDLYEQMAGTKKIISGIGFSNEATYPPAKLNEMMLGIIGQAAFSIMGYALTDSSSTPASYFVVGASAIGFICTLTSLTLKGAKKTTARILGKVGAMAAACAVIVAMGIFLPANTIWNTGIGIACLIAVVAVALA